MTEKQRVRREDEATKPLASYRDEELLRMKLQLLWLRPQLSRGAL